MYIQELPFDVLLHSIFFEKFKAILIFFIAIVFVGSGNSSGADILLHFNLQTHKLAMVVG
jgi:hypothetical protein